MLRCLACQTLNTLGNSEMDIRVDDEPE